MKHINKNLLNILFIGLSMLSCRKFVDIAPSPQLIATNAIFSDDNTAISAVDGVYASMRAGSPSFENGAISIYCGLSADEIVNSSASSAYDPFFKNAIPSNNTTILATFWAGPYNTIYRANAILEGLNKSTALSDSVKKQLTGEMRVVRALNYFYLTSLYGDVPLITSTDYQQNATVSRTSSSNIYRQMVTDLTDAESLLSNNYPGTGKARPNKQTAAALLARVYLYGKDWVNAGAQSARVINSGVYNIVPDLNSVFTEDSNETIWEIASPGEAGNTAEGTIFIPSSSRVKPTFTISPYLLKAFEPGDLRAANWLNSNTVSGTTFYYPYKYQNRALSPVTEYDIVLRLAEQYLIRAEARAQQSATNIPDAVNDLNVIRSRAGLAPLSGALSLEQCLAAVAQERRVELFAEWGQRWFDLKRTATIDAVLGQEKTGWQPFNALYPIPYKQIIANPALTQNPGYN
ncbi:RagB/SusD family nutrient uptake outer membrane protein [Mucilaginibacter sp.]|uniref:RagB/SusD family nutrient uptake outer membrane protein n=1 Tax=Mucilaginibacter sp. TaxID=1882438 RepID=UPI002840EF4A|nr:RagB/SusD family nutrient uptake outer membrane protein [Mucilaginibacter sp.]MDR3697710.1 RagB/SusD family nutrient uptake outer membrane protein [Mucilaginibacter sp.]